MKPQIFSQCSISNIVATKDTHIIAYLCHYVFPQRRPRIAKIFQLNRNKSETHKDISLKYSAFVYHMSGLS